MAVDRDQLPNGIGPDVDAAGQLCRDLELNGLTPLLALDSEGLPSCGVTLPASSATNGRFRCQLVDVLVRGLPLTVTLSHVGPDIFDALFAAADEAATPARRIAVVCRPDMLSPRECIGLGFTTHWLAEGLGRAGSNSEWQQLWELRSDAMLRISYGAHVLPACSLLSAECAGAVLPGADLQVPVGSAWVPVLLDLSRFASDRGAIDMPLLERTLRRCVDICDRLHGKVRWPTPGMRYDAWLNRRLAISVAGIGDVVARRGLDPGRFTTLQEIGALLRTVREILLSQSAAIAARMGGLPALEHFDPSESLPGGRVRHSWRERWLDAVAVAAVRHRNLLVLSPWALFPRGGPADVRYGDLLPLLRFADACALGAAPDTAGWKLNEFRDFHCRAMAVLQQREP